MFPKNAWYVAATPAEIDDKPLGRTVCNEKIVFWRPRPGEVAATEDFCPHRGAPLSLGRVCDGALVCGYHGLAMGCDGRTVSMPLQRVQGFPKIRTYPVAEKYGFIWVWPGDPALADPAKIHHLEWADSPDWAYGGGLYHVQCDWRLMFDNLMDLTHETYVHSTSIGQKEIDETPVTTKAEGFFFLVLEAMSCGTPVVAYDSTSVPEVLGGAGSLASDRDVDALAGALRAVLEDGDLAAARRAAGLVRAGDFSWERSVAEHARVYRAVSAVEARGR